MMTLWIIRGLFLAMCTMGGYAVSQVRPEYVGGSFAAIGGMLIGFGFGWMLIAVDEMLKGFSLRAFSATTFGLLLGTVETFVNGSQWSTYKDAIAFVILQPRAALLRMLVPLVVVLDRMQVLPPMTSDLEEARATIASAVASDTPAAA